MGPARASGRGTRAAFTLLEVVAACLIIVILVALAIPNFQHYMRRAGEAACMANMRSINVGLRGICRSTRMSGRRDRPPTKSCRGRSSGSPSPALRDHRKDLALSDHRLILAADGAAREDRPRVHYIPALFGPEPGLPTSGAPNRGSSSAETPTAKVRSFVSPMDPSNRS